MLEYWSTTVLRPYPRRAACSQPPRRLVLLLLILMSAYPAYLMGTLCLVGGFTGFARTRSVPSLVAGVGVGLLYLWSAETIRKGAPGGLEGALGASAILLLSSLPRASKGPVPAVLSVTSLASTYYYGKTVYALRG